MVLIWKKIGPPPSFDAARFSQTMTLNLSMVHFWWDDPLPFSCWFLVPPRISEITGKTVIEGGNVTLNCSAEGKPSPSITWTRLSDNIVVTMPLINIRRHDVRGYRCIADNGVGIPAIRHVTIDVQCKCCNEQTCTHIEYNVCVYHIHTLVRYACFHDTNCL